MATTPNFRAPWWARGPHAQTLWARGLRALRKNEFRRERWQTPDGDFLDLDFAPTDGLREDVLVLLLHGLEGSAHSGYACRLSAALARRRIPTVGLNFRSCSGEINRGMRLYHSGETGDPRWVIARLHERFPERRLAAVGVSLGGNVLLKYLGESGNSSGLRAATAWSVPFDLAAGADFMESGLAHVYVVRLLRSLQRKLRSRAGDFAGIVDLERALAARTFREFDDAATAPLHGFESAADYYARSSSASFIGSIATPTLVLHSRDDPFLPATAIPEAAMAANPAIEPLIFDRGGHVGFVNGATPLRPVFWAEEVIAEWLAGRVT